MIPFADGALWLAIAVDVVVGEPPAQVHPVVWMGRAIAWCERRALARARGNGAQLFAGAAMALGIPGLFAAVAWTAEAHLCAFGMLGMMIEALLLKPTFALRALGRAAADVRAAVAAGRIDQARRGLRALCSRDPASLDGPDLLGAAVESVAENASDSFVAPIFWFVLLGLPGAVFYRAVNTLDAMIGYHGRYEYLGKASARLDDALNWVPARVTAWLLLAGGAVTGLDAARGARILRRDARHTESPNAGHPMAAMAGLLGVALTKDGHYRLGDAGEPLGPIHVERAWRAVVAAAALAAVGATVTMEARRALGV
jgi:adenosylcobinamide-phosphate synthase